MSLQEKYFRLADGNKVPAIAYGVGTRWFKWGQNELDQSLVKTLKVAFENGFVHVDGAEIYGTDAELGEAIQGMDRSKLYLSNKFSVGDASHQGVSPHGLPYAALKYQLENLLKTDYVDMYLLHSPYVAKEAHGFDLVEAWRSMEKIVDEGLARSIGVSNFAVGDLQKIFEIARIPPVVNQIEFNALLQNQTPGIVAFCQQKNVLVEAYSPLGPITRGAAGTLHTYVQDVGAKHSRTPEQVLLRWVLQRGVLPVTTSASAARIAQMADIFDFELAREEVDKISALGASSPALRQWWVAEYSQYDQ